MKFGLLVVLAVAVLVPSLSEGRTVSKCELKEKLEQDQSSEETKQSSLGLYGIFQLSDETFCNSGYRSSKNKCNTTCDAFTDDNIMDDIDCFVKTDHSKMRTDNTPFGLRKWACMFTQSHDITVSSQESY
uniref:Glycosyl hydrolases family 22 (GH22) domain-containing protein n=1 Tax=Sander lucioperca TaxID=283035 RepID=A0A8C9YWZ3_SANLU